MRKRTEPPRGRAPKEGACNEPVDIGMFQIYYCHRDSVDGGLCKVHRAAKARGQKRREETLRRHRLSGWRQTSHK